MFIYSDLNKKNVVVTGANGDMGLAICAKYLEQGCNVYAIYHRFRDSLDELQLKNKNSHCLYIKQCNIKDDNSINELMNFLTKEVGYINVLVNNAGIVKDNLFATMDANDFSEIISTNLIGMFNITNKMLTLLRSAEKSTIINVSSIAGIIPSVGQINYSSSKAGIIGFTRTLAAELASKGVRVNAVAPGMIESAMVKKVSRQVVRQVISTIPLQRLGLASEVADVIVFLSSDASSYMVGQTLVVDGGMVMR
ncbi:MAG TPA: 3-oxoacyl-ACP reductase [Providencia sp.]|uniref:3-oxoacyl-ACP reductase FabG n=1 Tax=Providencia sp. TaxID=589 RepID=UPI000E8E59B1|nr:3-oxoacyl-ACP reductase FabG [Providencia sp.]MBP6081511.1 3-oxoacyl-ACP reductase FabG [Providencia sp.]HBO24350.1 3-oxoacyl-ACP reductase [Providencia sp.]